MNIELTNDQANIICQVLANTNVRVQEAPQLLEIINVINSKLIEENPNNIFTKPIAHN